MLNQDIIHWLRQNGDNIMTYSQSIWLCVSIALLFRLHVFRRQPLAQAPTRPSALSLQILAGVILLYIGTSVMAEIGLRPLAHPMPKPTATAPATLPATTIPAPLPGPIPTTVPMLRIPLAPLTTAPAEARAPASAPAKSQATEPATESATEPTTQTIIVDRWNEILGQLAAVIGELVPALLILYLANQLTTGGLKGWGFSLRKIPEGIRYGLLGFLAIYPLLEIVGIAISLFIQLVQHRQEEIHPTLEAITQRIPGWQETIFILLAGVAAPILEEIFFRGLLQTILTQRRWGFSLSPQPEADYRPSVAHRWGAILITSFLFAGIHFLPDHFPVLFLLSCGLGYLYERTGNLWSNITLHATFNCINMYFVLHSQ